jgi:PKD repeat protein
MRAQWIAVVVTALLTSACGLEKQTQPSLIGPANGGTSVFMAATPDRLPRDGRSQSVVLVEVRDAAGKGIGGRRVTLGITGGTLSQDEVVTGSDGRATFAVQAPTQSEVVSGNTITVFATPVTTDFANARTQSVTIALTGVTNSTAPTPAFTVTPATPEINQVATFDATTTTDEGSQCLSLCSYAWNFDDGATASGRVVTHAFTVSRAFNVALTVTDASGIVVTLRRVVTPTAPAEPTVVVTSSPNPPVVGQQATFNAVGTAAANHQVVRYEWDFGDGSTTATVGGNVTHTYAARGIYTLTVRAIDELGRAGSTSVQLNLTIGVPQGINATFFFTPTPARANQQELFNANESTPSNGAKITKYTWDWGTPGVAPEETTDPTITHVFPSAATYRVQLTITDSQGRAAINRQDVVVQ